MRRSDRNSIHHCAIETSVHAQKRPEQHRSLRNSDILPLVPHGDTFVTNQLRAEAVVDPSRPKLHHPRDRDGRHEVDVIADRGARGMVGIEIEAHSAPKPADARHLVWLRDELADRFKAGALLHTGPARYRLGDRIEAIPICTLWS